MDTVQIANLFGFIAAGIGIVMFIPQAVQVWKTKNTKSLSLATFSLLVLTSVFWLIYGVLLSAKPVILANAVVLTLSLYIAAMKLRYK
ncbi:MAG: SemiSWEET family transporter [Patescibacteria group bacterium]